MIDMLNNKKHTVNLSESPNDIAIKTVFICYNIIHWFILFIFLQEIK